MWHGRKRSWWTWLPGEVVRVLRIFVVCGWIRVFPKIGVPQNGWWKQGKTLWTNGWFGGTPILGNTHKKDLIWEKGGKVWKRWVIWWFFLGMFLKESTRTSFRVEKWLDPNTYWVILYSLIFVERSKRMEAFFFRMQVFPCFSHGSENWNRCFTWKIWKWENF